MPTECLELLGVCRYHDKPHTVSLQKLTISQRRETRKYMKISVDDKDLEDNDMFQNNNQKDGAERVAVATRFMGRENVLRERISKAQTFK